MTKVYELSRVETWLSTIIPDVMTAQPFDQDVLKNQIDWVVSESYRVQRELQMRFHELKPRHADQYIYMNQMDALRIMDIVDEYISLTEGAGVALLVQFYKEVYGALQKIMLHMIKFYPESINENLPMPHRYMLHEKKKLRGDYEQLLKLYDHPDVPKALLDVATRPLKGFFLRDNTPFTFHKLSYFKVLLHELHSCLDIAFPNNGVDNHEPADAESLQGNGFAQVDFHNGENSSSSEIDINMLIHYKLHFINFNNLEYRNYCTGQLHDKLEALPTPAERIERVNWYVTTERRQKPRPGMALEPGLPPISEQILHIIEEEYQYLISNSGDQKTPAAHSKIKVNLTSIELAQFAAVFEEAGLIQAKVVDIISHLAHNCIAEGGDDLQESSLRTQFYSRNNSAALQKLSTVLQTMQDVVLSKLKKQVLTIFWVITSNSLLPVI